MWTNEYECTTDQELLRIQRTSDIIRAWWALGQPADADSYATASGGRTSLPPSWKCDVISKIRLHESMRIYLKNNLAKFHPDPFWNFRLFWRASLQQEQEHKRRWSAIWDRFLIQKSAGYCNNICYTSHKFSIKMSVHKNYSKLFYYSLE